MKYLITPNPTHQAGYTPLPFAECNIDLTDVKSFKIDNYHFRGIFADITENELLYLMIRTGAVAMDHTHPELKVAGKPDNTPQRRVYWERVNKVNKV